VNSDQTTRKTGPALILNGIGGNKSVSGNVAFRAASTTSAPTRFEFMHRLHVVVAPAPKARRRFF